MLCNNDGCSYEMDSPVFSIYVADGRTGGAFWGHYCGPTCALADLGTTLMGLIESETPAAPGATVDFGLSVQFLNDEVPFLEPVTNVTLGEWAHSESCAREVHSHLYKHVPNLSLEQEDNLAYPLFEGGDIVNLWTARVFFPNLEGNVFKFRISHSKDCLIVTGEADTPTEGFKTIYPWATWDDKQYLILVNLLRGCSGHPLLNETATLWTLAT